MPQSLDLAWIEEGAIAKLKHEAENSMPFETGGCLMGYWVSDFMEVVVTEVIGPGPNATHGTWFFLPDNAWQSEEIARIYTESDRFITYLGDWHTHPTTVGSLSIIDKWTLMKIGQHKPARARAPLMGVMHSPPDWALTLYCRRNKEKRWLLSKGQYCRFNIKQYKEAEGT